MTCRRAGQVLASHFLRPRRLDEQQQHRLGVNMIASVTKLPPMKCLLPAYRSRPCHGSCPASRLTQHDGGSDRAVDALLLLLNHMRITDPSTLRAEHKRSSSVQQNRVIALSGRANSRIAATCGAPTAGVRWGTCQRDAICSKCSRAVEARDDAALSLIFKSGA